MSVPRVVFNTVKFRPPPSTYISSLSGSIIGENKLKPDLIESLLLAPNHRDFVAKATVLISEIECSDFAVSSARRLPSGEMRTSAVTNSDEKWLRTYQSFDFMRVDPRIRHAFVSPLAYPWDTKVLRDSKTNALIDAFEAFNHNAGISMPIRNSDGDPGMIFLTTSDKLQAKFYRQDYIRGKALSIGQYLHAATAFSIDNSTNLAELTDREITCLQYIARGCSAEQTARYMSVEKSTVRFHIVNARRKLGACNLVHAAALALNAGFISLD